MDSSQNFKLISLIESETFNCTKTKFFTTKTIEMYYNVLNFAQSLFHLTCRKWKKLRICETETANIEERYRKFQLRICETANIEDYEYRGIHVLQSNCVILRFVKQSNFKLFTSELSIFPPIPCKIAFCCTTYEIL